jgi:cytosine permease
LTCGLLGTLSAFLEILNHFLTFLFYLSIVFVPVASVILIDCLFLRPAAYMGPGELPIRAVEPAALLSWAVGAAFAVLGSMGLIRLTGVAALDAMFVTGILYAALRWRVRTSRAATAS